jgi:hypothetical protein
MYKWVLCAVAAVASPLAVRDHAASQRRRRSQRPAARAAAPAAPRAGAPQRQRQRSPRTEAARCRRPHGQRAKGGAATAAPAAAPHRGQALVPNPKLLTMSAGGCARPATRGRLSSARQTCPCERCHEQRGDGRRGAGRLAACASAERTTRRAATETQSESLLLGPPGAWQAAHLTG